MAAPQRNLEWHHTGSGSSVESATQLVHFVAPENGNVEDKREDVRYDYNYFNPAGRQVQILSEWVANRQVALQRHGNRQPRAAHDEHINNGGPVYPILENELVLPVRVIAWKKCRRESENTEHEVGHRQSDKTVVGGHFQRLKGLLQLPASEDSQIQYVSDHPEQADAGQSESVDDVAHFFKHLFGSLTTESRGVVHLRDVTTVHIPAMTIWISNYIIFGYIVRIQGGINIKH